MADLDQERIAEMRRLLEEMKAQTAITAHYKEKFDESRRETQALLRRARKLPPLDLDGEKVAAD
jgi:recombinational DNA repair ATPase RecF